MALPIIVMVVAMSCCAEPLACIDVPTLDVEVITQKDAIAAVETAEWNAQLDQSHNDTRSSCACVHVERIACDDNTQAETYFK